MRVDTRTNSGTSSILHKVVGRSGRLASLAPFERINAAAAGSRKSLIFICRTDCREIISLCSPLFPLMTHRANVKRPTMSGRFLTGTPFLIFAATETALRPTLSSAAKGWP